MNKIRELKSKDIPFLDEEEEEEENEKKDSEEDEERKNNDAENNNSNNNNNNCNQKWEFNIYQDQIISIVNKK